MILPDPARAAAPAAAISVYRRHKRIQIRTSLSSTDAKARG